MGTHRDRSINDRIARLLRLSFKHAKLGDEKLARSYWKSLVNSGYEEDGETKHEFEKAILAGLREHGLIPPVSIRRRLGVPKGAPKPQERSETPSNSKEQTEST